MNTQLATRHASKKDGTCLIPRSRRQAFDLLSAVFACMRFPQWKNSVQDGKKIQRPMNGIRVSFFLLLSYYFPLVSSCSVNESSATAAFFPAGRLWKSEKGKRRRQMSLTRAAPLVGSGGERGRWTERKGKRNTLHAPTPAAAAPGQGLHHCSTISPARPLPPRPQCDTVESSYMSRCTTCLFVPAGLLLLPRRWVRVCCACRTRAAAHLLASVPLSSPAAGARPRGTR